MRAELGESEDGGLRRRVTIRDIRWRHSGGLDGDCG